MFSLSLAIRVKVQWLKYSFDYKINQHNGCLTSLNRLQVKTEEKDGYEAVQVGYQVCKESRITKPELNHLRKANAPAMKRLVEFKVSYSTCSITCPEQSDIGPPCS